MNTRQLARFATASLSVTFGLASALVVAACSSDDSSGSNPAPTTHDSGTFNNPDGTVNPGQDSGPQGDDGAGVDSNLPDVGACTSDAATCNSCYTPQQDPKNGCSPATVNCIPFDNTRVPANAP